MKVRGPRRSQGQSVGRILRGKKMMEKESEAKNKYLPKYILNVLPKNVKKEKT